MLRTCVLSNKLLALIYTDFMYVHMTVVHIWIESPYIIFVLFLYKIFFFSKKISKVPNIDSEICILSTSGDVIKRQCY